MSHTFRIATLSPGLMQPSIAIAAHRAGELGILDFEFVDDPDAAVKALGRLQDASPRGFGIKLSSSSPELMARLIGEVPERLSTVIFTASRPESLGAYIQSLRNKKVMALFEATCLEEAKAGEALKVDGLVVKGHEAGGRVGDETTFVLLQRIQAEVRLPLWAHGGIGLHTAPACIACGAVGFILDSQLALLRESALPKAVKSRISAMDGSETVCVGDQVGETYRVYFRPGLSVIKALQEIEASLLREGRGSKDVLAK